MRKIVLALFVCAALVGTVAVGESSGMSDEEFVARLVNKSSGMSDEELDALMFKDYKPIESISKKYYGVPLVFANNDTYSRYDLQNAKQRVEGSFLYIILKSKQPGSLVAKFYRDDVLLETSLPCNFGTEKQEIQIPFLKMDRCNLILLR